MDAFAFCVVCENLVATCTQDGRLWIWISTKNVWIYFIFYSFVFNSKLEAHEHTTHKNTTVTQAQRLKKLKQTTLPTFRNW